MKRWLLLPIIIVNIGLAFAAIENYEFNDNRQQQRFKSLVKELRCLVCQNQNIADSNADLAKDLRQQIYEMISDGKTNQDIIDYMVARYGDFVLYRPPFKNTTIILWVGPFIMLAIAICVLFSVTRHGRNANPLNDSDREHIKNLLDDNRNNP